MNDSVLIEPAATLVLVRDSDKGPQVLMQQRNPKAVFVGGAWVFPGGKLDPEDSDPCWPDLMHGLNEESATTALGGSQLQSPYNSDQIHRHEASQQFNVKALAYWVAALREAFEEAGILLTQQSITHDQRDRWRHQLLQQDITWQQLIENNDLILDISSLHYLARWVTPPNNPRRYDTRFFIAKAPPDQEPSHEDYEAIETRWLQPQEALDAYEAGEMILIFPTIMTLKAMCGDQQGFASADQLVENVVAHFNPKG